VYIKDMSQTQQIISTVRPCKIDSATARDSVDLVVAIDTSPSVKDEASNLSNAAFLLHSLVLLCQLT
jgi:hypothetical protein